MKALSVLVVAFLFEAGASLRFPKANCPEISLRFGRVKYRQRGKIARFMCNVGYTLAGTRYDVCLQNQWGNAPPKCVRATCQAPKPPVNGLIYPSHGGGVLNFYCKTSFELRGASITYCDGTQWDNPLPTCLATNTVPALTCDFEKEDLCGWNHDLNHDFDWIRLNYATPSGSIGTGPTNDHTTGKGGYYMYIESSARNPNDTARLISPVYDRSSENVCFRFFYHMYGATTGDLRVFLKKVNDTWNPNPDTAVFAKKGNQGNKWLEGFVELGPIDDEFQIVVEGVRGSSYVSDIAIDDVEVILNCVPEEMTTTEDSSSATPISVESCENRCNTNDTSITSSLITCDCDDGCFDRNRCCPDYFDFCVFTTTEDDLESTVRVTTVPSTAKTITSTSSKAIATRKPTTTTKLYTATMKPTMTKKLISTTTKRPATTTSTTKTTAKVTTRPTTKHTVTTRKIITTLDNNDVEEVPMLNSDESEFALGDDKETEFGEYDSIEAGEHQKVIINAPLDEADTKSAIFAVGVVFGVLFAGAGMTFLARRYRLCTLSNLRRFHQSSYGDSQSDVRFLSTDERLDFNLPDDYDSS